MLDFFLLTDDDLIQFLNKQIKMGEPYFKLRNSLVVLHMISSKKDEYLLRQKREAFEFSEVIILHGCE